VDHIAIREVALDEPGAGIDGGAVPLGEIVEDGYGMAGIEEFLNADRADVSGAAGDEDVHGWMGVR